MNHQALSRARAGGRSRRRPLRLYTGLAAALVLVLSACGSGEEGSSGESGSSGGDTIKVMTWAPLESQLTNYPAITETAEAYEAWINDQGGIDGKQVDVLICDEKGDPTAAANCARKAIQEEVVAVVGSFGYTGDATIPLLRGADIAMFGGCCPNSAADYTSSNAFIMGNGPTYGAALADKAVEQGKKKIAFVGCDGCQTYELPVVNALKAHDLELHKSVILPAQAQDYSPQAAEALADGTDAVIMVAGADQIKAFMTAYKQQGSTARIYGPQGNLTEDVAKGFEKELDGAVTGNTYADFSDPVWDEYKTALEDSGAEDLNYNGLDGLGTWAAYTAFADIVSGMDGDITSKAFLDAAANTESVDTGGMAAEVDFTEEWTDGLEGYERLFNRTATFSEFDNGKLVPGEDGFKDYTDLMLGQSS